jgi:hypothetical protein
VDPFIKWFLIVFISLTVIISIGMAAMIIISQSS